LHSTPFLDVTPKVGEQRIRPGKSLALLVGANVAVIALAGFIVVAQNAFSVGNQRQSVL
jgi:hypothetical protein